MGGGRATWRTCACERQRCRCSLTRPRRKCVPVARMPASPKFLQKNTHYYNKYRIRSCKPPLIEVGGWLSVFLSQKDMGSAYKKGAACKSEYGNCLLILTGKERTVLLPDTPGPASIIVSSPASLFSSMTLCSRRIGDFWKYTAKI